MLLLFMSVTGGYLLFNVGKASSAEEGSKMIANSLSDGSAMAKFCQLLQAQGVSKDVAEKLCSRDDDAFSVLPKAKHQTDVPALRTGSVVCRRETRAMCALYSPLVRYTYWCHSFAFRIRGCSAMSVVCAYQAYECV